jgi:hypothetical protein
MANTAGKAYGLTLLCPIKGDEAGYSYGDIIRNRLENFPLNAASPMAKVPNTYMCRFYVLDDVKYQGYPAEEEHLKSRYLVFCCNFYGDLDTYLTGLWRAIEMDVRNLLEHCVAFNKVSNEQDFVAYVKKCQVNNTLYFNGSTDDPLAEQLKALYLKQEFSRFVFNNHGKSAAELQKAFLEFVAITQPDNLAGPSWQPGMMQEQPLHNYENHRHDSGRRE